MACFSTGGYAQYHYKDCPNAKGTESTGCTKKHKHRVAKACFKDPKKNAAQSDCDAPVYGKDIVYTGYYPKKAKARRTKAAVVASSKSSSTKVVTTTGNGGAVPVGTAASK